MIAWHHKERSRRAGHHAVIEAEGQQTRLAQRWRKEALDAGEEGSFAQDGRLGLHARGFGLGALQELGAGGALGRCRGRHHAVATERVRLPAADLGGAGGRRKGDKQGGGEVWGLSDHPKG